MKSWLPKKNNLCLMRGWAIARLEQSGKRQRQIELV